jgi:hypothetical protein
MPARRRITITETEEVASILKKAAARWPEVRSRAELLRRVALRGARELCEQDATRSRRSDAGKDRPRTTD